MMPGIGSGMNDLQVVYRVLSHQFYFFSPCCMLRMEDYVQKLKQSSTASEMVNTLFWRVQVMFVNLNDDVSASPATNLTARHCFEVYC